MFSLGRKKNVTVIYDRDNYKCKALNLWPWNQKSWEMKLTLFLFFINLLLFMLNKWTIHVQLSKLLRFQNVIYLLIFQRSILMNSILSNFFSVVFYIQKLFEIWCIKTDIKLNIYLIQLNEAQSLFFVYVCIDQGVFMCVSIWK